jgi:SAM-dependent methyltransferase
LQSDVRGWLEPVLRPDRVFLDVGCGAGSLIAAAAANRCKGIGVDVSMTWLVVAKRLISEAGAEPVLAAAMGEALPLEDNAVYAIVSLDVIEHVSHPRAYLSEIHRVVRHGGRVALSTPNRFSLTPEPHVFVWGVGWLPARWQAPYVRWRSGKAYRDTRLVSSFGLRRLVEASGAYVTELIVPPVPEEEIDRFAPVKASVARMYNRLATSRWLRWFFLLFGPFFRIVATKRAPAGDATRVAGAPAVPPTAAGK